MTAFYEHLSSLKEFCDKGYFWEKIFVHFIYLFFLENVYELKSG